MKSEIRKILEREQRAIQAEKTRVEPPSSTYDVIARCSSTLEKPVHLDPYVQVLDKAIRDGDVKCVFAAPPQHGKTLIAEHALIFAAMWDAQTRPHDPRWHAYSTFSFDRARQIRNDVMRLAFEGGLDPHGTQDLLELAGGTRIKFGGTSAGSLTGFKVNGLHVIDDPIKDRKEANSPVIREDRWNWFVEVAGTRMHPGSSVLLMMTRWHLDDLSGRVVKNERWPYLRIPAICDDEDDACGRELGAALWPSQRPLEWLKEKPEYRSPMTWAAMYQGQPRPQGDALFDVSHVQHYDSLPSGRGYRLGYGADLAYTEKTRADWSVLLQGRLYGQDLYLTKLLRKQVQADKFTALMRAWVEVERGDILWFGSTTEKGIAQMIRSQGGVPSFHFKQATEDKYVRATPTAEHFWNLDRVFLPAGAPWVEGFEDEVCSFSGMGDAQDDQVDAFAALGSLFLRGYGGRMGAGKLNASLRGALGRSDGRIRLVG